MRKCGNEAQKVSSTLVLLEPFRLSDLIQDDNLLDNLVVQRENILALYIGRAVTLQKFQLSADGLQLVENRLLFRIQRYPW